MPHVLQRYLDQLAGGGTKLDLPYQKLAAATEEAPSTIERLGPVVPNCSSSGIATAAPLVSLAGSGHVYNKNGLNNGIRIVAAMQDTDADNAVVVLPCSHKSNVEPPSDVFNGCDLGCGPRTPITLGVELKAGDVLLCASRLLHGVRGAPDCLEAEYIVRWARPSGRTGDGPSATDEDSFDAHKPWFDMLSDTEKTVLGHLDGDDSRPIVVSDGTEVVVQQSESGHELHPTKLAPTESDLIDDNEFYFCG